MLEAEPFALETDDDFVIVNVNEFVEIQTLKMENMDSSLKGFEMAFNGLSFKKDIIERSVKPNTQVSYDKGLFDEC